MVVNRRFIIASVVLCRDHPLPGLPDHTLHVLNHDRTDHNTKTDGALVHSNSSLIPLLLNFVINHYARE